MEGKNRVLMVFEWAGGLWVVFWERKKVAVENGLRRRPRRKFLLIYFGLNASWHPKTQSDLQGVSCAEQKFWVHFGRPKVAGISPTDPHT